MLTSNTKLWSLQSGIPASGELAANLKSAKSNGEKMVQKFMDECVFLKMSSLNDRIPRNKCLTLQTKSFKIQTN